MTPQRSSRSLRSFSAADPEESPPAYAIVDTPIGELLVAATAAGTVRVAFAREGFERVLDDLSVRISSPLIEARARVREASNQLIEYLTGRRRVFALELDRRLSGGFRRRVLDATAAIPYGQTSSYRSVAAAAGNPAAARAAGSALATNPLPLIVPCHRVLRSSGETGAYGGGGDLKRSLLEMERRVAGGEPPG